MGIGGIIILALILAFFIMRWRKQGRQDPPSNELPGDSNVKELSASNQVNELPNDPIIGELASGNPSHKNEGGALPRTEIVEIDDNPRNAELPA